MFSLFSNGIKEISNPSLIDFPELVKTIRDNPNANKIDAIRNLRINNDSYYKKLKAQLPYLTPNCMVKIRSIKDDLFDQNFIQFSKYMYFDIDVNDAVKYKENFISKYGNQASMICLSSSGGGISVLFKLKNTITRDNFDELWLSVRNTILKDEPVDMYCKDIGRAMFISHDPKLYFNYDNEIEVEIGDSIPKNDQKRVEQCKTFENFNNTLNSPFSIIPLNEILKKLCISTRVDISYPVVDFKPVEYVKFYIPEHIKDGTKHKIYTSMIHTLVYLNPTIEEEYIFSYLFYINNRFAKPKMERREFIRTFNHVYKSIKDSGNTIVNKTMKYVHFNWECEISKEEKMNISNMVNGKRRINQSIEKIQMAREQIHQRGYKMTQKRISEISGLTPKTVRKHLDATPTDMNELVEMINNTISSEWDNQQLSSAFV